MTLPKKAFQDQKFNFSSGQKFSVNDKRSNFFRWTQLLSAYVSPVFLDRTAMTS
jgi:hypothetical protein